MRRVKYIDGLDGLRGLAAAFVLTYHVFLYFAISPAVGYLHAHAYLAVDCFYVISGFVIAHSFDRKMSQGMSIARFFWLRILRLYPMIIIGTLLGSITLIGLGQTHPEISPFAILWATISGFLLVPTQVLASFKPYAFPVNSPFWSLSFEMVLYFAYALFFRSLRRSFVLAGILVIAAAALMWASRAAGGLNVGFNTWDYDLGFGRVVYPFLAGVALRRSRLFNADTRRWGYLALPLLCLVLLNPIGGGSVYDSITVLGILPLVVLFIANAKGSPVLDRISRFAGELSYPVYAIHFPIVVASANICKMQNLSGIETSSVAAVVTILVIVGAYAIHRWFDVPVRTYLGGIADGRAMGRNAARSRTTMSHDDITARSPAEV